MKRFHECPVCGVVWPTRDDFLGGGELRLVGYQAHFEYLKKGFFLFAHLPCQTTLTVSVSAFEDLYAGPFWAKRRTGEEDCRGYCRDRESLDACAALCECRWVREVLGIVRWRLGEPEAPGPA